MDSKKLIRIERPRFENFLVKSETEKSKQPVDTDKLLRRITADEINGNKPSSIGQYVDPSIQEKWTYWLAAAESKYEDFVLMPKEPNSQILSEIELTEGWSEVALTTRYKAMLAVAQKLFF